MLTKIPKQGDLVLFASALDITPKREPELRQVEFVDDYQHIHIKRLHFDGFIKFHPRGEHYSLNPSLELFDSQEAYDRALKRFYHFAGIKEAVIGQGVLRYLSDETLEKIFELIKPDIDFPLSIYTHKRYDNCENPDDRGMTENA